MDKCKVTRLFVDFNPPDVSSNRIIHRRKMFMYIYNDYFYKESAAVYKIITIILYLKFASIDG